MSNFDGVDRRHLAFCLVVNGLADRYCSNVAPGGDLLDGTLYDYTVSVVQAPRDVFAIEDVGPIDAQLDDVKGIAAQEPVEVKIRARDGRTAAGLRVHPQDTLLRTAGPAAADRRVKLLDSLDHEVCLHNEPDITVTRDVSTWTLPGPIHRGQEVIWADSFDGDGTPGDPWRFTGCSRGADHHATQPHIVSDRDHEQPWITSDVVTWRGRKAAIYVSGIDGDGNAIGWSQYWSGWVDSPPESDGELITVRIAPLSAVMRYRLGVASAGRTALSTSGAHWIRTGANGVADRIDAKAEWRLYADGLAITAASVFASTVTFDAASAAFLDSLGAQYATSGSFGMLPWLFGSMYRNAESPVAYASPVMTFAGGSAFVAAAVAGGLPANPVGVTALFSITETHPIKLVDPDDGADQVVTWPEQLSKAINTLDVIQHGPIGSWSDPTGGGAGDSRLAEVRMVEPAGWNLSVAARDDLASPTGTSNAFIDGSLSVFRGGRVCWAGWVAGEDLAYVRQHISSPNRARWRVIAEHFDGFSTQGQHKGKPLLTPIGGPAVWYYQPGEPYVGPFDIDIWPSGTDPIRVQIKGAGTDVKLWIDGVTSDTHPGTGEAVYWYSVHEPDDAMPVVQMEGDDPFELQVIAGARNTTPPKYIRRLLESGVGNGNNGTWDTMPIGANVPYTLVDEASFGAMAAPGPLAGQDYTAVRGKSIEEQTEGLLMACGAQVVSAYSEALDLWRIACVHMGPADAMSSKLDITDGDLIIEDGRIPVRYSTDGRTVRSYRLTMNYPDGEGDPETVEVGGNTERNDAGADSGDPLELELPGVVVIGAGGIAQAAAEIVADMRTRVGVPRVRWSFSIRADMAGAIGLGLADVVTLTSNYAIGIIPSEAVVSVPCRIVGMHRDLVANRLDLDVRPFPGVAAGWAPAARVDIVNSATSIDVELAAFSAGDGPGAGTGDASFFLPGHKVSGFAPGAWSARSALTVNTVSGLTITFTGAHGLSVGNLIRLNDYAAVVAAQKGYAFLSDTDGTIGADPGYVIG